MSNQETLVQFSGCWEGLEDPRSGNAGLHDFHEFLVIALCAAVCGGQGALDMALFAKVKKPFLRGFLELKNGVPSHDSFSRLFRSLDPDQFRASFQQFMAQSSVQCQGVVAIDGKVLRRSFDRASGKSALHMVNASGCQQRLVLAQIVTDAKSNEITAVQKLHREHPRRRRPLGRAGSPPGRHGVIRMGGDRSRSCSTERGRDAFAGERP